MARKSSIAKNERRKKLVAKYAAKRAKLKAVMKDDNATPEERMAAQFSLQKLPRNSASERVRNRCAVTGRPRGYYRKFGISRIALRDLGSAGYLPGVVKSSW